VLHLVRVLSKRCILRLIDGAIRTVQALVPPTSLIKMGEKLHPPALSHITPISPNFTSPVPVPVNVLDKWPDTAAMLIPGPSVSESSSALMALGDCLLANHLVEAAHAWYVSLRVVYTCAEQLL
jgi:COPII coat assembly protein SEC16